MVEDLKFGIVQADQISVLVNIEIYPIHFEYLCYNFLAGAKLRGQLRLEKNIKAGSTAIAPELGYVKVLKITNGKAYFENMENTCNVRLLVPMDMPALVFVPTILI